MGDFDDDGLTAELNESSAQAHVHVVSVTFYDGNKFYLVNAGESNVYSIYRLDISPGGKSFILESNEVIIHALCNVFFKPQNPQNH